jgi:hypothetical protein
MDNLGDWLYVIFLVVAGVSGFISSGKKKRMLQEEERKGQHEIVVEPASVPELAPVRVTVRPKKKNRPISPVAPPPSRDTEEPEVVSPVVTKEFYDPEALRKAIIYTEIFNRKY